jgi:hypothetical protein
MLRSLSLRYLAFNALLIPKMRGFSPRPESATFLFATMLGSIKLLQKIIAPQKTNTSQKNQHIPGKPTHPRKNNTSHVATIFCNHLAKFMLPKRRFWMAERTFGNAFSKYLSKGEYSFWATFLWNQFENAFPNVRSAIQNLRLGSINFLEKTIASKKTNTPQKTNTSQKNQPITCCYYLL